ncbi:hypothetical protein WJX82_007413 [Trebouxia sp. C0006]
MHLAFGHDFTKYQEAIEQDTAVIQTVNKALQGSGKLFVTTCTTSVMGDAQQDIVRETALTSQGRGASDIAALAGNDTGLRAVVVRLPPFVYARGFSFLYNVMYKAAEKNGSASFVGAVHVDDAARAYVALLTHSSAKGIYNVVGENGVTSKDLAERIASMLHCGTESITREEAQKLFGFVIAMRSGANNPPELTAVVAAVPAMSCTDTGPTQQIFRIAADTWLNLRTGFVAGLNTTQSGGRVYTFNSSLNGQVAKELVRADSTVYSTIQSISRDAFFGVSSNSNEANGLSYYLYPPPAYNSVEAEGLAANLYNWMQNVESLRFYTGFIAMQGSRTTSRTTDTRGWYELAPLLDYLTLILKTVTVSTDISEYTAQYLGQLNTTYVQTNSEVSPQIYATLKTPSVYIPYDTPILDPALGLTESECIVRAKNYTLTQANVQGTPPANVWNYCSTGVCNYTMVNGTQGTFISPYAGTHTTSICQMGYSAAVDSNEYVEPAYITGIGQGTAGRFNPDRPSIIALTYFIQTSNSSFVGSFVVQSTGVYNAIPLSAGASNA